MIRSSGKRFISKSQYDTVPKFKCPLNLGFWHYSPNGCCLFINSQTQTIHHLYLRETCSLTRTGSTIHRLLARRDDDDDSAALINGDCYDGDDDDDIDNDNCTNQRRCTISGLDVILEPYLNNTTLFNTIDQRLLQNMTYDAKNKLLAFNDELLQQFWFVRCDTGIEYDTTLRNISENVVQHLVIKNIYTPLSFLGDLTTFQNFFSSVTYDFVHRQMPILNNMTNERLMAALQENISFIQKLPAQRMLQYQSANSLFYVDGRDIFDIVKLGSNGAMTNLRLIHLVNEANFIDTWRRVLFNFVQELVNIHTFDRQSIRVRSACNAAHFIKGNNKSVVPEFRCDSDTKAKCVHLMARRKEYEMFHSNSDAVDTLNKCLNTSNGGKTLDVNKYTIMLNDKGTICRYVLETMVEEYGEEAVDKELNFYCMFDNTVFEQDNFQLWERVMFETLNVERRFNMRESSGISRERISCMQELCQQKRMNDIHRFCLPRRFLTLAWFQWACNELRLGVFDED